MLRNADCSALRQALDRFLESLSWGDMFNLGGVWDRAKRIVTEPIGRIIHFVGGLGGRRATVPPPPGGGRGASGPRAGGAQPGLDVHPSRARAQDWGVSKAWDHIERWMAQYPTIVTAVIANHERIDGIEVIVQQLDQHAKEVAYLQETVQESYVQMDAARGRVLDLLHHLLHRLSYKKRTETALEVVQQLE
jgi:hypothetical protein